VSEFKGMLILNTGSDEVKILMPQYWSVTNEVVGRSKLLNSTYSFPTPGENTTATFLQSRIFSNTDFSIQVMVCYEITNVAFFLWKEHGMSTGNSKATSRKRSYLVRVLRDKVLSALEPLELALFGEYCGLHKYLRVSRISLSK
jgi:hypothetical protein